MLINAVCWSDGRSVFHNVKSHQGQDSLLILMLRHASQLQLRSPYPQRIFFCSLCIARVSAVSQEIQGLARWGILFASDTGHSKELEHPAAISRKRLNVDFFFFGFDATCGAFTAHVLWLCLSLVFPH